MASDVSFLVIDPQAQVIVLERWIGGNGTRDRVFEVLARPPDYAETGWQSWGRLRADEVLEIAESAYSDGADDTEVRAWLAEFPPERFWWTIVRDY